MDGSQVVAKGPHWNPLGTGKWIFSFLFFVVSFAIFADHKVTLSWDPSTDIEVTGAIVHYGNSSRTYPYYTNVGNVTRATVNGLQAGLTYYFAVTAINSFGLESDYSIEVSASISNKPHRPTGIRFVGF